MFHPLSNSSGELEVAKTVFFVIPLLDLLVHNYIRIL